MLLPFSLKSHQLSSVIDNYQLDSSSIVTCLLNENVQKFILIGHSDITSFVDHFIIIY